MRRLLVVILLFTLALSACGGDDGDSDDVAARSATTSADDGATSEDDEAEAEASDSADEEFSGEGSDDFCDKSRRYTEKFEDIAAAFGDPEESEKQFEEFEDAIEDIAEDAPSEIAGDVDTVVKNFKEVKALFEKYDYEFSKIPPEESEALDNSEAEAANSRVNAYMEKVCGIDTDKDGDTDGSDTDPTTDTSTEE